MVDFNETKSAYLHAEKFLFYEKLGVTILTIYFVLGFPSNILLVVHFIFERMKNASESMIISYHSESRIQSTIGTEERIPLSKAQKSDKDDSSVCGKKRGSDSEIKNKKCRYSKIISRNPHRASFELYLLQLSICDIIITTYNFIEALLLVLHKFNYISKQYSDPVLLTEFACRSIIVLNRTVVLLRHWIMTAMAGTRLYAVKSPFSSTIIHTTAFYYRLNACIVMIFATFFILVNIYGAMLLKHTEINFEDFNSSYLNSSADFSETNNYKSELYRECRIDKDIYEEYPNIEVWINITIGIVGYCLPCLLTSLIDLCLICSVRKSDSVGTSRNKRLHNSIILVLVFSIIYLVCYLPFTIVFLLLSLDLNMSAEVVVFVTYLRYLNHVISFYVYLAVGKTFRKRVFAMFSKKSSANSR